MSMLRHNGARLSAKMYANMQSIATRRFYGFFYKWSRIHCSSTVSKGPIRTFHLTRRLCGKYAKNNDAEDIPHWKIAAKHKKLKTHPTRNKSLDIKRKKAQRQLRALEKKKLNNQHGEITVTKDNLKLHRILSGWNPATKPDEPKAHQPDDAFAQQESHVDKSENRDLIQSPSLLIREREREEREQRTKVRALEKEYQLAKRAAKSERRLKKTKGVWQMQEHQQERRPVSVMWERERDEWDRRTQAKASKVAWQSAKWSPKHDRHFKKEREAWQRQEHQQGMRSYQAGEDSSTKGHAMVSVPESAPKKPFASTSLLARALESVQKRVERIARELPLPKDNEVSIDPKSTVDGATPEALERGYGNLETNTATVQEARLKGQEEFIKHLFPSGEPPPQYQSLLLKDPKDLEAINLDLAEGAHADADHVEDNTSSEQDELKHILSSTFGSGSGEENAVSIATTPNQVNESRPETEKPENESNDVSKKGLPSGSKNTLEESSTPKISIEVRQAMRALPASVVVVTTAEPGQQQNSIAKPNSPERFVTEGRGLTVSSFTTVTLTPHPIIQFNIKSPSRTLDALMKTRHFFVHMLQATESGAAIAAAFSKGTTPEYNPFSKNDDYDLRAAKVNTPPRYIDGEDVFLRPKISTAGDVDDERPWIVADEISSKRPPLFSYFNLRHNVPLKFPRPSRAKLLEEKGTMLLPRIHSKGILRVLHCQVLDRGARGGRGDGFVTIGDHTMILARVHRVVNTRKVLTGEHKGLAYAHGNFITSTNSLAESESGLDAKPEKESIEGQGTVGKKYRFDDIDTGNGLVIRKLASKGNSLREIGELAAYYAKKSNDLQKLLGEGPHARLRPPQQKTDELAEPRVYEQNPMIRKEEGLRVLKHFSTLGNSLEELKEIKQMTTELGVPGRIAREAMQTHPDALAEKRQAYAVLKALEELRANKAEMEALRAKAMEREGEYASNADSESKKGKVKTYDKPKERPAGSHTFYKYESDHVVEQPEMEPKLEKVWEKVAKFKALEGGLSVNENPLAGLEYRPEQIVGEQRRQQAKEIYFETKEEVAKKRLEELMNTIQKIDDEADIDLGKALKLASPQQDSRMARRSARMGVKSNLERLSKRQAKKLAKDLQQTTKDTSILDALRMKQQEEDLRKEKKSLYVEADPFAEEFM